MMMTKVDHEEPMIIGNRCTCGSTQNGHEVCVYSFIGVIALY